MLEKLKACGWKVGHTGGGVLNAWKDFRTRFGEAVGICVGLDCATAYYLGGSFLSADEIAAGAEWDEGVVLADSSGPTEAGRQMFGEKALREMEEVRSSYRKCSC